MAGRPCNVGPGALAGIIVAAMRTGIHVRTLAWTVAGLSACAWSSRPVARQTRLVTKLARIVSLRSARPGMTRFLYTTRILPCVPYEMAQVRVLVRIDSVRSLGALAL